MNSKLSKGWRNDPNDTPNDVPFLIPGLTIGTLINMLAIGKRVICDGSAVSNRGLRRAAQFMEQLVYEQTYEHAGPDEVWKNPKDGSYHHPTFPEQEGEAWAAMEQYDEEVYGMKLVESLSRLFAERDHESGMNLEERLDHHEHRLLDLLETDGPDGLLKVLIAGQENS